jgi:autotransporter-associated beta strand protein
MAGGTIDGSNATLQVGSQAAGDFAGLIMNGGTISAATLAFGATEAVIYAANPANVDLSIDATLSGTGGLTLTGPGTVTLTADSSSSLSGPIMLNSGTLAVAGSGSTGSGAVTVSGDATLNVTGTVDGAVNVGQSGVLSLNGGTVQGDVTIAAIGATSAEPGGILEGAGTLNGAVTAAGNIQAGPTIGILTFTNTLTLPSGSAFYWRLVEYADNANCPPGVCWNALQISQPIWIGASIFLDFSLLGEDPDGGNPFWLSKHRWTIWSFKTTGWDGKWAIANRAYLLGDFTYNWAKNDPLTLWLEWTPLLTKRTPAERLAVQASAIRPTIKRPTSLGSSGNVSR